MSVLVGVGDIGLSALVAQAQQAALDAVIARDTAQNAADSVTSKYWSMLLNAETVGGRIVLKLDWTGGEGTKPASGYVTATGKLTGDAAQAVNIRGPVGSVGNIAPKSIGAEQVTFAATGKNLFNKNDPNNLSGQYIDEKGVPHPDANYTISHYVPVAQGQTYTANSIQYIAFFDSAYKVIAPGAVFDRPAAAVTIPEGVACVKLTVPNNILSTFQFEAGSAPTVYAPYEVTLLAETQSSLQALALGYQSQGQVEVLASGFIVSRNLYNKLSARNLDSQAIDNVGNLTADSANTVSHFIAVTGGQTYTPSYVTYVTYYDAQRRVVGAGAMYDRPNLQFSPPAGVAYIRITVPKNIKETFMIASGNTQLAYEPYGASAGKTAATNQLQLQVDEVLDTVDAVDSMVGRVQATQLAVANLFEFSANLFNPADANNQDGYYIDLAGAIRANDGTGVSHYIPVKPSTVYVPSLGSQFVAYFDANKNPLGIGASFNRTEAWFTTSESTFFIRAVYGVSGRATFTICQGKVPTNQAYGVSLKAPAQEPKADQLNERLALLSVPTKNLYNKNDPDTIANNYMDTSGNLIALANYSVSGFIAVTPGQTYVETYKGFVTYFDAAKRVKGGEAFDRPNLQFTPPAGVAYIRITVPDNLRASFVVMKGNAVVAQPPYGYAAGEGLYNVRKTNLVDAVIWVGGTSIPAQGGYWELAASQVGAKIENWAVPSSAARRAKRDGTPDGIPWETYAYALTHTLAEKETIITNWSTIRTQLAFSPPATLSDELKAYIRNCSYEYRLVPFLDGRKTAPALFALGHGYNGQFPFADSDEQYINLPADPYDKNYENGAINFIIRLIYSYLPDAIVLIEGHYDNQQYPRVAKMQQLVADYWNIPLLRYWEKLGFSQRVIPNTKALWSQAPWSSWTAGADTNSDMTALRFFCPDGVHPHSDTSGRTVRRMAKYARKFLEEIL